MPQVFVYVRNDDLDKWKAVEKKSEFLHLALNRLPTPGFSEEPVKQSVSITYATPLPAEPLVISGVVRGSAFVPKPPDPETGYPCCLGKRPCKHWQWDGNRSAYVNSLTGKEREVAF